MLQELSQVENSQLYEQISSQGFTIEAIIQVGSRSVPELVDKYSDIDLLILVSNPCVTYLCPTGYKTDTVRIHWTYVSFEEFLTTGQAQYNWKLATVNPYCYCPIGLDSLRKPLFVSAEAETKLEKIDIQNHRYNSARHYIYQNRGYVCSVLSGGYDRSKASKKLHYLIHSLYILKRIEDTIDWEQLLRIKRCNYAPLTESDITFINNCILELVEYIRD